MTNNYEQLINQFTINHFKLPFTGKVKINPSLKHVGGRYLKDQDLIELSPRIINAPFINPPVFDKLLYHEGVHWALKQQGLPYGDHLPEFERYLQQFKLITSDPLANNYGATKSVLLCYEQGTAYYNPATGVLIRALIPNLGDYKIFSEETYQHPLVAKYTQKIPLYVTQYV